MIGPKVFGDATPADIAREPCCGIGTYALDSEKTPLSAIRSR